jgi:DUF971 family protein
MTNDTDLDIWPEEIRLHDDGKKLAVTFENGETYDYTAEFLRVTSPSAEVQGHHPSQRKTVPGKANVKITKIEPSGNYAVKLVFDDGHDTGLFTWDYFLEVGRNMNALWRDYLDRLEKEGLTREG